MKKLVLLLFVIAATAAADPMLDFTVSPTTDSGSLWYGGAETNGHLIGLVGIQSVTVENSVFDCWTCSLYFETDNLAGSDATSWTFDPGFFGVYGGVDLLGNGDPNDPGNIPVFGPDSDFTTLASGLLSGLTTVSIVSEPMVDEFGDILARALLTTAVSWQDFNTQWAAFFGIPSMLQEQGDITISFLVDISYVPGEFFTSSGILGGMITGFSPTPEANSLLLLALALMSVWAARRYGLFKAR